jgi:5'(3')-deoxyribonucleotidase
VSLPSISSDSDMTKKQTIAIDIDDTIADSTESIRLLVNNRFGVELGRDLYRVKGQYSGYYTRVWQENGIGDQVDFGKIYDEMIVDQSHVPVLAGASFAVHELAKRYHIVLVTARDASWEPATRRWFKENFDFDDVEVHFAGNYHSGVKADKGELCVALGASLLIDDNPDHCLSALKQGVKAVLFGDYGWHTTTPDGVTRCQDWPSVLEYLSDV